MARNSALLLRVKLFAVLAFGGISPALAADEPALVTIRFNQSRVYYEQQLYSAVSKAVSVKPDVMFEVVSYAPSTGDEDLDQKWQKIAGHNTRAVINSMSGMGVPMERITVSGQAMPGIKYDETRVFVH